MKTTALLLCAFLSLQAGIAAAADPGPDNCRVAAPVPEAGESVTWKGSCKDGFAEGAGVLLWQRSGKRGQKFEVTLVHGAISGEGTMSTDEGDRYIGSFKNAVPDGKGYFKFLNGDQYEGDVADGQPDGVGTMVQLDRSRYEGQWKNGKRDGTGHASFALGGSYDGQWKQDRFDKGVLTYGSGRRYEGEFRDGQPLGAPPAAPLPHTKYTVRRDHTDLGSMIPSTAAIAHVPAEKSYAELTPEQKAVVRADYAALDPEDEPPYPLNGPKALFLLLSKISGKLEATGLLRLYVLVGADGKATSVTAIGSPTPELTRLASLAVLMQKYKAAICHGQPCAMIYPLSFDFTLEL